MKFAPAILLALAFGAVPVASAAPVPFSASGSAPAITTTVDAFRAALGPLNANVGMRTLLETADGLAQRTQAQLRATEAAGQASAAGAAKSTGTAFPTPLQPLIICRRTSLMQTRRAAWC
mgnify:CR=1 FL=1